MHKGTYADDCIVNRVEQVCIYALTFDNDDLWACFLVLVAQVLHCGNM